MECQATSCLTLTQSEPLPTTGRESPRIVWPAQELGPAQRRDLAIRILAGEHSITELAREYQVSRKFLYRQVDTASLALAGAFEPSPPRAAPGTPDQAVEARRFGRRSSQL